MSLPIRWVVGILAVLAILAAAFLAFYFWYIGVFDVFPNAEKTRARIDTALQPGYDKNVPLGRFFSKTVLKIGDKYVWYPPCTKGESFGEGEVGL